MQLDNEEQRTFILQMMAQINFPGAILDQAYHLKQAVLKAVLPAADPRVPKPNVTAGDQAGSRAVAELFNKAVGDS
jgi:hypothetical protein